MKHLHIDIETYSETDITNCGVYKYIEDPKFEILLIAYAVGHNRPTIIDLAQGESDTEFREMLFDPDFMLAAHNATFERLALSKHYGVEIPIERWYCTMALAARSGLPLALGDVANALGFDLGKMSEGKKLIRYFCVPCKETKVNGGRTRNLSHHKPDDWETFKAYCVRDVEVEQEIYHTLAHSNPATPMERDVYILDQRINDRGVALDMDFINGAVAIDEEVKEAYMQELRETTVLDNPKSGAQMKKWLSYQSGRPITGLTKKDVPLLIEEFACNPTIKRVLWIYQQLGKTSTAKYTKMQDVACNDHRGRGFIQYYGANRTGRFAGRLVQVQNLPQNHLDERVMDTTREVVRDQDTELMLMQFTSVTDTLSQMIRTAFVPSEGKIFAVADYAQIEARVIAWIAGEQWRLDTFKRGEDIYISSASMMFGVPKEQIHKGSELRVKGKVAELACIAEDSLVLTDRGHIPIQDVTTDMRLWDGLEWINHEGVIYRGKRSTVNFCGLRATLDHKVWVYGIAEPIPLSTAISENLMLYSTEYAGEPTYYLNSYRTQAAITAEPRVYSVDKVYDILNAGRYNRFTVSGKLVHNCGFGGGVGAIKAFAKPRDFLTAEEQGLPNSEEIFEATLQKIITKWRNASPAIVRLWYSIERAFSEALETGEPRRVQIKGNTKHLTFRYEASSLTIELPSGRKLFYYKPSFTTNRFGSQSVQYWGMNQTTKQWQQVESYGGKLTENIVQAVARDLICEVMLKTQASGFPIVLHVHDEECVEVPRATAERDFNRIIEIMAEPIDWARGLPTRGAGFLTEYYRKD